MKFIDILTRWGVALALCASIVACSSSGDEPDPAPGEEEVQPGTPAVSRTVLVYMVADNSLGNMQCDVSDLEEMHIGVERGALGQNGRLLIYRNSPGTARGKAPVLYEITAEGNDTLKIYPTDLDIYSVDQARMTEVLNDAERFAPAESRGIVLWSHGSGWQETANSRASLRRDSILLTSFGEDRGKTMKVTSLAKALKGRNLDFIYFDCCFMMSAEVAYELRDCARYMAGSVTELPTPGTCYDLNLEEFFRVPEADMVAAARNTFNFYNSQDGQSRTCTMSVFDLSQMGQLASATRAVMEKHFTSFEVQQHQVQKFVRDGTPCSLFDMEQYMELLCKDDTVMLEAWREALHKVVIYAQNTPYVFNQLRLDRHCGMASYIIAAQDLWNYRGYNNQAWWEDVVKFAPVFNQ